jgi:hypothetical protein
VGDEKNPSARVLSDGEGGGRQRGVVDKSLCIVLSSN